MDLGALWICGSHKPLLYRHLDNLVQSAGTTLTRFRPHSFGTEGAPTSFRACHLSIPLVMDRTICALERLAGSGVLRQSPDSERIFTPSTSELRRISISQAWQRSASECRGHASTSNLSPHGWCRIGGVPSTTTTTLSVAW